MDKLRNKFIAFMYGRSGPDRLYRVSTVVFMVLATSAALKIRHICVLKKR